MAKCLGSFENPIPYSPEAFDESFLPRLATDQKTIAERRWHAPTRAPKPQLPCDHGLFSDECDQLDLVEMFQDPTNGD